MFFFRSQCRFSSIDCRCIRPRLVGLVTRPGPRHEFHPWRHLAPCNYLFNFSLLVSYRPLHFAATANTSGSPRQAHTPTGILGMTKNRYLNTAHKNRPAGTGRCCVRMLMAFSSLSRSIQCFMFARNEFLCILSLQSQSFISNVARYRW